MEDKIFGELEYDEISLCGKIEICFFNTLEEIEIQLNSEDGECVQDGQYDAYNAFIEAWPKLQNDIATGILKYYNEEEKGSYGPDDDEKFKSWWPDIEKVADLIPVLHLQSIIIPDEYLMDSFGGRTVYVLFDRDWGGEDYDDHGVAVRLVNESVQEVGYKDMAY